MKKLSLIFLFIFISESIPAVAEIVPVLLRVPRAEQADTFGCNIVEQVTSLVFNEIMEGRVKLWDSPSKEIQITGTTLAELEKSTQTKFIEQEVIFIYENWNKTKTGIGTNTIGFAFLNNDSRGMEVSYGFVDYNDLKETFMRRKINTNANGFYEINFATYIYKKLFNYNIVQFNGKPITTGGESKDIKLNFIGNLEINPAVTLPSTSDRFITYIVDDMRSSDDPKTKKNHELLKQIENYLVFNEEVFYNIGGDRILNFIIQKSKIKVTKLEVNEIWKKSEAGITYDSKLITIFVNDSALNPVSFEEFINWGIQVNDKSSYEIFREKDFSLIITVINSQKIPRKDSYLYYKGLLTYDWKKLSEFVKYY